MPVEVAVVGAIIDQINKTTNSKDISNTLYNV